METIVMAKDTDTNIVERKKKIATLLESEVLKMGTKVGFMQDYKWQQGTFYALTDVSGEKNYTIDNLLRICDNLDLELTIKPKRKK